MGQFWWETEEKQAENEALSGAQMEPGRAGPTGQSEGTSP